MSTKDKKEVARTGHVYDGIEELDHPTPNWFQALFYVTIVFGTVYFFHYSVGEGPSLTEEYEKAKAAEEYALSVQQTRAGGPKVVTESELVAWTKDPERKKGGAAVFQARCASCHGTQGQGGIGPNLTDRYWLHGGKMADILAVVAKGVPAKGMPPWEGMMSAEEIQGATVFIRTIADSNPAGAKAPQGELVKPE